MSKVLIAVAHARHNSLTHQIALRFAEGLVALGHETETADLAAEGFDPVLRDVDEPDGQNRNKVYSPEVEREWLRVRRHDFSAQAGVDARSGRQSPRVLYKARLSRRDEDLVGFWLFELLRH